MVLTKRVKTRVTSTAFLPGEFSSQVLQQGGMMNNFGIKDTHTHRITKYFIKMYIESRTCIKHIREGVCRERNMGMEMGAEQKAFIQQC